MLELEEGNPEMPSGNLLAYSMVDGFNPIERGGKIIVCNVIISFIAARQNHFPVIIFAPISLKNRQELDEMIELKNDYDVYRLEDFSIPDGMKIEEYVKERVETFNEMVMQYLEMCRISIQSQSSISLREIDNENIMEEKREKEYTQDSYSMDGEEKSLNLLQKYVDDRHLNSDRKVNNLRDLVQYFEDKYPKYDIRNLERVLLNRKESEGDIEDLSQLYLEKYRAIYAEKYEKAQIIQNRIKTVEKNDSSGEH